MITITIEAHPDRGPLSQQVDDAMEALGFERRTPTLREVANAAYDAGLKIDFALTEAAPAENPSLQSLVSRQTDEEGRAAGALRERGKPSPGHARRTKAEIAEDDAADKADAALKAAGEETGAVVPDKHVEEQAAISTGGPRVDPNNPEDDAQDAADEAADTAATSGAKLTHDSVRSALGAYVQKFGMDAAQQDGPKIIGMVCGEGKAKISDIPDDQAALQKVVDGVNEMLTKNPFSRTAVA